MALNYARNSAAVDGDTWTKPVVALRSPSDDASDGSAYEPTLAVLGDRLHVLWSGGPDGKIWYSRAFLSDVDSAGGWEVPRPLPAPSGSPSDSFETGSSPHLVADAGGTLHALYAVPVNEGRGIYYVRSDDGGETWSDSVPVFGAAEAGWAAVDEPRLALDGNGVVHATWVRAALAADQPPQGVYYARSEDGGGTWSEARLVAEGAYGWPQVFANGPGTVHLLWNAATGSRTWFHRWTGSTVQRNTTGSASDSAVEGQNAWGGWTRPEQVPGFGNVPGPLGLVADEGGTLHMTGLARNQSGETALLYVTWSEGRWGEPETQPLEVKSAEQGVAVAQQPGVAQLDIALRALARHGEDPQVGVWHSRRMISTTIASVGLSLLAQPAPPAVSSKPEPVRVQETRVATLEQVTPTAMAQETRAATRPVATPTAVATLATSTTLTVAPGRRVLSPLADGEVMGIPLALLLGGGLAALVVVGIFGSRLLWAGRQ
jgi:hypothetical protein